MEILHEKGLFCKQNPTPSYLANSKHLGLNRGPSEGQTVIDLVSDGEPINASSNKSAGKDLGILHPSSDADTNDSG